MWGTQLNASEFSYAVEYQLYVTENGFKGIQARE